MANLAILGGALLIALTSTTAHAQDEEGLKLQICVKTPDGEPVKSAVIRNPVEKERHRVNTVTGCWAADVMYLPNGEVQHIVKGSELAFDISAVDHTSTSVVYIMRKRRNLIEATLERMPAAAEDDMDMEMPIIGFDRSVPLDGVDPATQDDPSAETETEEPAP